MGFTSDFFRAYVDMMEDAGFIEGFIIFVLFEFLISMVYTMLFMAVVLLAVALCNLWSGAGASAATEEQAAAGEQAVVEEPAAVPVDEVADLPAGGELAARAVRRRRAARDAASGEPGSSSSSVVERESE